MSHNKIKAAARQRVAATGEPYAAARRQANIEHSAAHLTSAVSADDVRAAAAAHRELGPEYSDAVVASFIEKVDRAVAARVEARLADQARQSKTKGLPSLRRRLLTRRVPTGRVARDILAASAGALVVVGAVGLHAITSPDSGPAAGSPPVVHVPGGPPVVLRQLPVKPGGKAEVHRFMIVLPGPGSNNS